MSLVHLRTAEVSVVLRVDDDRLPSFFHWGMPLPESVTEEELDAALHPAVPHSSMDVSMVRRLAPMPVDGWRMRPALTGSRADGRDFSPALVVSVWSHHAESLTIEASDETAGVGLSVGLRLHDDGLLEVRQSVTNTGQSDYLVSSLEASLPVPMDAVEILDLTGRWCRERTPQRHTLPMGTWLRESRHGRTGHDAPLALCIGLPGFGFRSGQVWAVHLAWSGDSRLYAERHPVGWATLGAGELLAPGEIRLAPGETYAAPTVFAAYSSTGLDGISRSFHGYVRSRASHPRSPRPVLLNTWEAVYFAHRLEPLAALADAAAEVGIERFVLDDGWFGSRRHDRSGLGDWVVSDEVWPDGLTPLIDHVRSRGMDFGLWVEPEMANPDSDLLRAHPDWVLAVPGRTPYSWRHQQVIDLANDQCYQHILERLDVLLRDHDIAFLKWDHNRDLIDPAHESRPAVHAQTTAVYRLLDELRQRHPGVEIETCASGGGRVDLGILARTDRLWASDTIDALERQSINLWTSLVIPPELIGQHIGGPHSHTTGRQHPFSLRAASAVFGHMGIEWNLTTLTEPQRRMVATAIAWHKEHRELLHTGDVVRLDQPTRPAIAHGVVSGDRSRGVFSYAQLGTAVTEQPGALRLDGLDPERVYRVAPAILGEYPISQQIAAPRWVFDGGADVHGGVLMGSGLVLPVLHPEQALLISLTPVES